MSETKVSPISSFINLNNFEHQCSPFPTEIVEYIHKNAKILLSRKLMMTCKSYRAHQVRNGICHIEEFGITHDVEGEVYVEIFYDFQKLKLKQPSNKLYVRSNKDTIMRNEFGKFKVAEKFRYISRSPENENPQEEVEAIIKSLDLTEVTNLYISGTPRMSDFVTKKLFSKSLKNVELMQCEGFVAFVIYIFENLKNVISLTVQCPHLSVISTQNFTQLLKIQSDLKFKNVLFEHICHRMDPAPFFEFMRTYMRRNGTFSTRIHGQRDEIYEFKRNFKTTLAALKEDELVPSNLGFEIYDNQIFVDCV